MIYEWEKLIPVMMRLADCYTAKESTSIPYETAQQLMGAALYCIRECSSMRKLPAGVKNLDYQAVYEKGYQIVLEKVTEAKHSYHRLLKEFNSLGCRNYEETLQKGMPEFFKRYDARFEPQNHFLTLDYPVLGVGNGKSGVDLILDYLREAEYEQNFMNHFDNEGMMQTLEENCTDYRELYLDNLCEPVLLRSAACLMEERHVFELRLTKQESQAAKAALIAGTAQEIENRLSLLLDLLEKQVMKEKYRGVFRTCGSNLAVRLLYGAKI